MLKQGIRLTLCTVVRKNETSPIYPRIFYCYWSINSTCGVYVKLCAKESQCILICHVFAFSISLSAENTVSFYLSKKIHRLAFLTNESNNVWDHTTRSANKMTEPVTQCNRSSLDEPRASLTHTAIKCIV